MTDYYTAAIIQARMGSTRFPGKVRQDIWGRELWRRVVDRVRLVEGKRIDEIVLAIPDTAENDELENAIRSQEPALTLFRGSEGDVLDRYVKAARLVKAELILRVTADCPLLDPGLLGHMIDMADERRPGHPLLLVTNNVTKTWPTGLDAEVVSIEGLELTAQEATEPYDREHVLTWPRDQSKRFLISNVTAPSNAPGTFASRRWTVDTEEDLDHVRALMQPYCRDFGKPAVGASLADLCWLEDRREGR